MYSRKLKNLGIGIIFEKENINTLDSTGELLFTILSSLAQDESRNISENCKWGIRTKFKNGELHLNTCKFLGYDKDEEGKLVINPKEGAIVKRIYDEFIGGRNPQEIASGLEEDNIRGCTGNKKWYTSTIIGILKNEKHMGDALLQKTYTADFLTKKQVKNNGAITQVYVEGNHKGIVDKETWYAVQEEFERRDDFLKRHGITRYCYGSECNPFTSRVFCGKCGSIMTKHSWKNRGVDQYQCKNHRADGKLTCTNDFVDKRDLEKGFVKAYNTLIERADYGVWNDMIANGTPLQRVRGKQMIELADAGQLTTFVPELAQLVLTEVMVYGANTYEFEFMDGCKIRA